MDMFLTWSSEDITDSLSRAYLRASSCLQPGRHGRLCSSPAVDVRLVRDRSEHETQVAEDTAGRHKDVSGLVLRRTRYEMDAPAGAVSRYSLSATSRSANLARSRGVHSFGGEQNHATGCVSDSGRLYLSKLGFFFPKKLRGAVARVRTARGRPTDDAGNISECAGSTRARIRASFMIYLQSAGSGW